jgi:hypothetical protein
MTEEKAVQTARDFLIMEMALMGRWTYGTCASR